MSASFRPAHRVRKQEDFQRVYQARAYAANDLLVVNGAANGLAHSRLGLSVSKRVGNAVVRNRWKRLIREAFRLTRSELPSGFDLVVRPQNGAKPELEAIQRALGTLARRIAKRVGAGGQRSEVGSQGSGGQPE